MDYFKVKLAYMKIAKITKNKIRLDDDDIEYVLGVIKSDLGIDDREALVDSDGDFSDNFSPMIQKVLWLVNVNRAQELGELSSDQVSKMYSNLETFGKAMTRRGFVFEDMVQLLADGLNTDLKTAETFKEHSNSPSFTDFLINELTTLHFIKKVLGAGDQAEKSIEDDIKTMPDMSDLLNKKKNSGGLPEA